jgi:hypothetical protein
MSPSGAAKPALLLEVAGDLEQKRGGRLIPPTAWLRVREARSEAFAGVTLACRAERASGHLDLLLFRTIRQRQLA